LLFWGGFREHTGISGVEGAGIYNSDSQDISRREIKNSYAKLDV
jgi:hypothetical protein